MHSLVLDETSTHIKWDDWPFEIDDDPDDHWVAVVEGFDPDDKFLWDSRFLSDNEKEGDLMYNVVDVGLDDVLRVKAGDERHYFEVVDKDARTLDVEEIDELEAVSVVGGDPEDHPKFTPDGVVKIQLTGAEDDVDAVTEILNVVTPRSAEISFASEYQDAGQLGVHCYGDIQNPQKTEDD